VSRHGWPAGRRGHCAARHRTLSFLTRAVRRACDSITVVGTAGQIQPMTSVPLSVLDELYLNLDRRAEPWTVHYEVRLRQRLEGVRMAGAIATAAVRHPLARARLASWRFEDRGYRWEIVDELDEIPLRVVACDSELALAEERERLFATTPSLDSAPPFTVVLVRRPDGDSVLLNLHHAAGDGVSAARLMLSVLRAYAGEQDPVPRLDPLALHDVRRFSAARSLSERLARGRLLGRSSWRPFVTTARVARDGGDERPAYGFETLSFSRQESRALFASHPRDTTVNDILLAALAFAIARWNAEHGQASRLMALTMPVNVRPPDWELEVLGNYAPWVTVWIRPGRSEDLSSVIARVGARTHAIKRDRLGGIAVDMLELPGRLPIAVKRCLQYLIPLTGNVVVDTAALSNLGRLERLPAQFDAPTAEVLFSPPGRMPLGLSIGAVTLEDRLHLTLRYRHPQFGPDAARRFMMLYRDVLRDHISMPPLTAQT
jgi:NRPS condensation-like uncharacterized protein